VTFGVKSSSALKLLLVGLTVVSGCHAQQKLFSDEPQIAARLKKALDSKLEEFREASKFPGLTFAFLLPDGRSVSTSVGYSDVENKVPMRPNEEMLSGSIGKTYVAAVMLQLVEEGRAKLDENIQQWLGTEPWFNRLPNAKQVTLRMLLNHTSGIPPHVESDRFVSDVKQNLDKVWTPSELITYVLDKPPLFPAGQKFEYSETNYILVGMIIEKITQNSYYDELKRRILIPFHLNQTKPSNTRVIPGLATAYTRADNPWAIPEKVSQNGKDALNPQIEWTGGGLVSTSLDLARFAQDLFGGKILKGATLREMITGTKSETGDFGKVGDPVPMKYGLGVMIRNGKLGVSYGHAGDFPGYRSFMFYYPKYQLAIALQINKDAFNVEAPTYIAYLDALAGIVIQRESNSSQ
jgi:D-alanyl-D-alanine carboxypeptidase